jgi:thiol-disulfide isomerase/thioredoxin
MGIFFRIIFSILFFNCVALAQGPQSVRPWLGIEIDAGAEGVKIKSTFKDTPAANAGLEAGDEVLEISGLAVKTPSELIKTVGSKGVGHTVQVKFKRAGKIMTKDITLVVMPDLLSVAKKNLLNQPAPKFDAKIVRTKNKNKTGKYQIGSVTGRVTILEFWATWCVACVQSHPFVLDFAKQNEGKIDVVAISADKMPELKRHFAKLSQVIAEKNDPIIYVQDEDGEINKKFMTPAIPMFVLIDKQGNIVEIEVGGGSILQTILQKAKALL